LTFLKNSFKVKTSMRFRRLQTLRVILETGLVPVFYHAQVEVAKRIATAVAEGGAKVLEFTNRGEGAHHVFEELSKYCEKSLPQLILGVGSVIDEVTAVSYINDGANFVVGPILNKKVAFACNRRKVPYSPGCGSVSEISQAEELGVEICKIFPGGQVGGPDFVKAVKAPMPWVRIMPTGGVDATRESIFAWITAGADCVGMGSRLIQKELVKAGDFKEISRKVAAVLTWIQEAREEGKINLGI
jgi:2-dehydro-3-deoxyphosphogluconate aldolase/(4S)-4-hydroxy-2-oxoglutarate aldolase